MQVSADMAFHALGNQVRRDIMAIVAGADGVPVGDIAARLPVSRPAVSKHLRVLERAGLVAFEPRGTSNVYRLSPSGFDAAREWLDSFWDGALARFKEIAEEAP